MATTGRTIRRARELRRKMTLPEVLLWEQLKGGRLEGLSFRKQHPVGPFIVDFYCATLKLAVEVDGEAHWTEDNPEYDARRTAYLERQGLRVVRFGAQEVLRYMDGVLGFKPNRGLDRVGQIMIPTLSGRRRQLWACSG